MKKIIFSGFMGALLSVPAFAAGETSLTTKGYVDDGLRAVYNASKSYTDGKVGDSTTGLTKDVNDLKNVVNGDGTNPGLNEIVTGDGTAQNTGLVGDVAALDEQINGTNGLADDVTALQNTVGDTTTAGTLAYKVAQLENNPSTQYNAGTGIDITNGAISVDGLATTQAAGNTTKMYIYQNGALTEMPVVSSWSTDGLTF